MEHECSECGSNRTSLLTFAKHGVPVHEGIFTVYCRDCHLYSETDGASALLPDHDASKERGEV